MRYKATKSHHQIIKKTRSHQMMMRNLSLCALVLALTGSSLVHCLASESKFNQIPGLYEASELLKPIQGETEFHELVSPATNKSSFMADQQLALVQYYMATCPDCQGFSPYFKRFVADIGPHWRNLVSLFVVNCNDDQNIHLCWSQNSELIVPLVRWYSIPQVLQLAQCAQSNHQQLGLTWTHRQRNYKQRRDLISLRHGTLDFMEAQLRHIRDAQQKLPVPIKWRLLESLPRKRTSQEMESRVKLCLDQLKLTSGAAASAPGALASASHSTSGLRVHNFVIFVRELDSYAARTVIADWSNHTCTGQMGTDRKLFMVHYVDRQPDERHASLEYWQYEWVAGKAQLQNRQRLHLNGTQTLDHEEVDALAKPVEDFHSHSMVMKESDRERSKRSTSGVAQRARLEDYYKRGSRSGPQTYINSLDKNERHRGRRAAASQNGSDTDKDNQQMLADNINWAPPRLYAGEETLRRSLNLRIHEKLIELFNDKNVSQISVAGFPDGNPGELLSIRNTDPQSVVPPKDDDLTPMRLTDYYKILSQIVNKNILSKKQVDGFQLLGSTCMIGQLVKHFPFQGGRQADLKSPARSFLEQLEREYLAILNKHLGRDTNPIECETNSTSSHHFNFDDKTKQKLSGLKIATSELESKQAEVRREHDVGLPNERHFSWAYCRGSKDYLRGHTCSLWVLFHTMTVHEYLASQHDKSPNNNLNSSEIYEYKVNYQKHSHVAKCDPKNPEEALLSSATRDLFTDAPKYALGAIINFVRYYMGCTNCASHFNCMVRHSEIDFDTPKPVDHLLWVWEAHNRVNLRTKNTHSEDPTRPKHIFPTYDACPECYVTKPHDPITNSGQLDSVKFYKRPLVEFLVARYRRSAILNNKIRIEDLFRKPTGELTDSHSIGTQASNQPTASNATASLRPARLMQIFFGNFD